MFHDTNGWNPSVNAVVKYNSIFLEESKLSSKQGLSNTSLGEWKTKYCELYYVRDS